MFPSPYGESFSKLKVIRDGIKNHIYKSFRPLTGNHLVNMKKQIKGVRNVCQFPSPYGESFSK